MRSILDVGKDIATELIKTELQKFNYYDFFGGYYGYFDLLCCEA